MIQKYRAYDTLQKEMLKPVTLQEIYDGNFNEILYLSGKIKKGESYFKNLIIMPFIGYLDLNNKEIYADDIVRIKIRELASCGGAEYTRIGIVRIKEPMEAYVYFRFDSGEEIHFPISRIIIKEIEVLGNMHENLGLLSR